MPATPPPVTPPTPGPAAPVARINPTGRDITLSAPLRDGNFLLSEVGFILGADDSIRVERTALIEALRTAIVPEQLAVLETALAGPTYAPIVQIEPLGYRIRYDPAVIGLVIDIPPTARPLRDVRLRRRVDEPTNAFAEPAGFSGYVNLRSFVDYEWQGPSSGISTPSVLVDSAIRLRGIVLENEGTLEFDSGTQGSGYTRQGTRLVYDDRRRLIRFGLGDQLPIGRGLVGSAQVAGFSAVRQFYVLDPLRQVQPQGDRSFTLTRTSTVEALINGQAVRRLRLEPGTYNVRDFPFVQGINDIQFNIEDEGGGRQTLNFTQFFDRSLLDPGLTEFAFYGGVLNPQAGRDRDYQFNRPASSGWIRRGFSDTLTLGANYNARSSGVAIGAEGIIATRFGTLGFDGAVSRNNGVGTGFGFNIGAQRTFGGYGSRARAVSASIDYRSRNFATPGTTIADNPFPWNISGSYSQAVGQRQYISLTANYTIAQAPLRNETSARLTYGYSLSSRATLTAEATYEDRNFLGREYGLRLTLIARFGRRSSGTAEIDTRGQRARLGYQTSGGDGAGSYNLSADGDFGVNDVGFNGSAYYSGNRAEVSASHNTIYDFGGRNAISNRSSLRVATALVFADGAFAVGRPVTDTFVLVTPHKSLRGQAVFINPNDGNYTARSGILGGAVEPNLSAYISRTVTYDVPGAPSGYDLGTGSARVMPPYRAGYRIVAGSDYSITATGVMIGLNGQPISLLAGRAYELANPDKPPLTVFTNRTGRFGLSGMRSGRWRIDMPTEPPSTIEIDIPDGETGIVRLGELRLGDPK